MKHTILAVCVAVCAVGVHADDLIVSSISENGEILWDFPTNDVERYRIEWAAPAAPDRWSDICGGIQGVAVTGATMSAQIPMLFRVRAIGIPPANMVYIPAGRFDMGDSFGEGAGRELPVHSVHVSAFWMDRYEVSSQLWHEVYSWALTNGYTFVNTGLGASSNHPVHSINWFDAVKWCNARSERESLTPCYYTDSGFANIFRTGEPTNLVNDTVDWTANGYRLPTEAEWEKAARGGSAGQRFPWGSDTISHARANYFASSNIVYSYDLSAGEGYHPDFVVNSTGSTCRVDYFTPNAYGLYGCAGNVLEWCWDWRLNSYYESSPVDDPRGPTDARTTRVLRGGGYNFFTDANYARVSQRFSYIPGDTLYNIGFRCARGL